MHLFILALPLTLLVIGAICYKRAKSKRQQAFEEPPIEGYYVYPLPLPHQPGQRWVPPETVNTQGHPANHNSPAFAPQPAPYNQLPNQPPPSSLIQPSQLTEILSTSYDTQIRSPDKVAQPGILNPPTNTITSDKMLLRHHSSLLLPTATLRDQKVSPPIDSEYQWAQQEVQFVEKPDSKTPGLSGSKNEPESRPSERATVDLVEMKGRPVMEEELKYVGSGSVEQGALNNFTMSMPTVEPTAGVGTTEARDITKKMGAAERIMDGGESMVEANQSEVLPHYTSADAQIFERYQNRLSLKQDHSYIGRLRDSYHPPETVSAPKRTIRDDNFYLQNPSNPHPKP